MNIIVQNEIEKLDQYEVDPFAGFEEKRYTGELNLNG